MPVNINGLGKFLAQELTIYDDIFYEMPTDDLWGAAGLFVPSRGDLPFGVETLRSFQQDFIGRASISDGRAFDVPLVDYGITGQDSKAIMVIAGAEWAIGDIHRDQLAATNRITPAGTLVETKQEAVKIAIDRRIHELVYGGAPEVGFFGLFNSPKVSGIDQTAVQVLQMTATEQYAWLQRIIGEFKVSSKLAYSQIKMYVSDNLYTSLTRRFNDQTGDSAFLLLTDPTRGRFLGSIEPISELTQATLENLGIFTAGAQRERLLLGDFGNDRSILRHFHVLDRTDPFPKDSGIHWGVTGFASTSETIFKVPQRFQFVDYGADPTP